VTVPVDIRLLYPPACENMSGREGWVINMLTLHFTKGLDVFRGDGKGTAEWVRDDPDADASANYFVSRGGAQYECVPPEMRAWHHGKSRLNYKGKWVTRRTDRCAVGIEMGNCGHMVKKEDDGEYYFTFGKKPRRYPTGSTYLSGGRYEKPVQAWLKFDNGQEFKFYWEPYPEKQVESVTRLSAYLVDKFDIPIRRIVGHEDVALEVGRKLDPGPMWDWETYIANVCALLGIAVPDDAMKLHKTTRAFIVG
jgi:N-acetyl-anhydromuramyl-L-alanine amidase AmpD